jgi:hypothetical protein
VRAFLRLVIMMFSTVRLFDCLNLFNSEQVHAWINGTVLLTAALACSRKKTHRVATVGFVF